MGLGIISFVGLGPHDPSLCTARGAERIAQADVLVDDEDPTPLLALIALAREGKRVVRAVLGDPLESPRGLDEVREVARAGVSFEIVPGIGSTAAAASFAGVIGRALRVAIPDLKRILEKERPDAPVTLVLRAGEPAQRVIVSTAGAAPDTARGIGASNVILAFGAPEEPLRWFESRPLFGKRVLVTRAQGQTATTADLLRDYGAEPLIVPTIVIHPPSDAAPLARALNELRRGGYTWVAFTSANGVERTWEALDHSGGDARIFGPVRVAAIGPATARALEGHGIRADVVAKEYRGEGLASEMLRLQGAPQTENTQDRAPAPERVLLARASRARDALPDALRAAGWAVDVVAAYETHPPPRQSVDALVHELEAGRVDAVTFTSSSTVDNLCDLLGNDRAGELLARTRIASIGPLTSQAARARGLRVDVTAAKYTVPELVRALADSWAR